MIFLPPPTKLMAQSSKTAAKGQSKGKNPNVGVAPPPTNSVPSFSVPSSASGAGSEASNDGKIAVQQNSKVKTANIHCGSMLQRNKEMGPRQRGVGIFCGHVAFAIMILQALISELKAICWGFLVDLEHVNQ